LLNSSQIIIPGIKPYVARTYPAGSNFSEGAYPARNIAEFCRFGAHYNTSSTSSIQFEVWLPTAKNWNGRFAHVGGGGNSGTIYYQDMGLPLTKYGFAIAGTNAGHNGSALDGTYAMSNPDSQLDFGYRASHLSTVLSKQIVQEYYKKQPNYSYWMGCSGGGRQGMKEVQEFPKDYDGAIIGAPALWWTRMAGFFTRIASLNANSTTPGQVVPASFFPTWAKEVMNQCDELDGIKDNIILTPHACNPDTSTVVCGSSNPSPLVNASTCITESQATTLEALYQNWTSIEGKHLSPSFVPGSEAGWQTWYKDTSLQQLSSEYFLYQVYNHTSVQPPLQVNETELERITAIADVTNPGRYNTINPDLRPFFKRGGKVLQYHGLGDAAIPPGISIDYYEKARAYLKGLDITDSYRLFLVPGMAHCLGGTGADSFGRPTQLDDSLGGNGQSLVSDSEHDAVLALMRWVEKGEAPKSIIGASYIGGDRKRGVAFTRLLCPYPQRKNMLVETSTIRQVTGANS